MRKNKYNLNIIISFNEEHKQKQFEHIFVTEFGIIILLNFLQPKKQYEGNSFIILLSIIS